MKKGHGETIRRGSPKPIGGGRFAALAVRLLVAVACMVGVQKCSHRNERPFSSALPEKSGGDTIDVAIEISPLAYSLAGDTVSGLDFDLLRAMASRHGRAVKFHPFAPLQFALDGLENGNFDILVAALPSTRKLKSRLRLTESVYLDREVLVQRAGDSTLVRSQGELAGKTVWIPDGSPIRERIENLADEIGDSIIVRQEPGRTSEHLVMLVAAGEVERAVVNEGIARSLRVAHGNVAISTPVSFTQFQVWALNPANKQLADTIDSWLRQFKATPEYRNLLRRYHHE